MKYVDMLSVNGKKMPDELLMKQLSYLPSSELQTTILALLHSEDVAVKNFTIMAIKVLLSRKDAESLRVQIMFFGQNILNAHFFRGHEEDLMEILPTAHRNIHASFSTLSYWTAGTLFIEKLLNSQKLSISCQDVWHSIRERLAPTTDLQILLSHTDATTIASITTLAFSTLNKNDSNYDNRAAATALALVYPYTDAVQQQKILKTVLCILKNIDYLFLNEVMDAGILIHAHANPAQQKAIRDRIIDQLNSPYIQTRWIAMLKSAELYSHSSTEQKEAILTECISNIQNNHTHNHEAPRTAVRALASIYPYANPTQQESIRNQMINQLVHSETVRALASIYPHVEPEHRGVILTHIMAKLNDTNENALITAMSASASIYSHVDPGHQQTILVAILTKLNNTNSSIYASAVSALISLYLHIDTEQQTIILSSIIDALNTALGTLALLSLDPNQQQLTIRHRTLSNINTCQIVMRMLKSLYPHVNPEQKATILTHLTTLQNNSDENIRKTASTQLLLLSSRSIHTNLVKKLFTDPPETTLRDILTVNQLCNSTLREYAHSLDTVMLTPNHVHNINKALTGAIYLPQTLLKERVAKSLTGGGIHLSSEELDLVLQTKNDNGISPQEQRELTEFKILYMAIYKLYTSYLKAPNFLDTLQNKSPKKQYDAVFAPATFSIIFNYHRIQQTKALLQLYWEQDFGSLVSHMATYTHTTTEKSAAEVAALNPLNYNTENFMYISPYDHPRDQSNNQPQKSLSWDFYPNPKANTSGNSKNESKMGEENIDFESFEHKSII